MKISFIRFIPLVTGSKNLLKNSGLVSGSFFLGVGGGGRENGGKGECKTEEQAGRDAQHGPKGTISRLGMAGKVTPAL
jgi:hypothetical protein